MSKAWECYDEDNYYVEVVFADTRGKAKSYLKDMDAFDNMDTFAWFDFCELRPSRAKSLDYLNYPDGYVMNWFKDEDRIAMVRHLGVKCDDAYREDCEVCCAKEWCSKYEEYQEEDEDDE